jgi:hypothetical protein
VQYIFEREQEALYVHITGSRTNGYSIVVREPDGSEEHEQFASSSSAHARWAQLREDYKSDGWSEPSILD